MALVALLIIVLVISDASLAATTPKVSREKAVDDFFTSVKNGDLIGVVNYLSLVSGTALEDAALNLAVTEKRIIIVHYLLDNGANPNATDTRDGGKSPLNHAAEAANLDMIHLLLRYKAGLNRPSTSSGITPLISAVMSNSIEACRLLVDLGANINKTDHYGNSPLHYAIGVGNVDMILMLLGRNARVDPKRDLYYAASIANVSERIVVSLLNKGADINAADKIGRAPLYYAVRYKNLQLVQLLLQRGADPNLDMNGCNAPLYVAVITFAGVDICRALVDYGAHYYDTDCTGRSPLQAAEETKNQQPQVYELLYEAAIGKYAVTGYTMAPVNVQTYQQCGCCASRYVMSIPDIRVDKRQGIFRFEYSKDDPDLNLLTLHFNINKPLRGIRSGDFNFMLSPTALDGFNAPAVFRFTSHFPLQTGDKINYWLLAVLDGRGFAQLTDQTWTFHGPDEDGFFYPDRLQTVTTPIATTAKTTQKPMTTATRTRIAGVVRPWQWPQPRATVQTSTPWQTSFPMGPREDIFLNLTSFFLGS